MRRLVLTLAALLLLALPASVWAADHAVTINDADYTPAAVDIRLGDTVTWTNASLSPLHSATSDAGDPETFDSGPLPSGAQFTNPFNTIGIYPYHDNGGTQTGTVTVYGSPDLSLMPAMTTITRGQSVVFTATGASNPAGGALSYEWDLDGDGTYETTGGTTQTVVFPSAGLFSVGVRVTDPAGNQTTSTSAVQSNVPDSDGDGVNDDADKCPSTPGHAPDGCPPAASPPAPSRPIASQAVAAGSLGLGGALRSGVNVVLNCSGACTGDFTLTRSGKDAVLPTRDSLTVAGTKLVTLKFTNAAKRSLAKLAGARLQLKVVVTDAAGRVQIRRATVTLKAVKNVGKLPAIGISDNNPATFADPNFQVLKLRYARLVSPWNAIFSERQRLDAWLQAARAHGVRPLVSFEHTRGQQCPGRKCKGPSASQYRRAWKAFHKKYPWVKDISPWNEVNSATQPTGARPDLAAAYYNVVRASCRGCTIVAADLLDATNIRRYAVAFLTRAKGKPRLWGLHNYTDTNRFRSRGTAALLQTVKGTVWLTETGGVVRFVTQKGKVALPKSETRARKAMDYMFRLAEANAARIKRIYVYQWKVNNPFDRFDAGVISPGGKPRPSYDVLSVNASIARKR